MSRAAAWSGSGGRGRALGIPDLTPLPCFLADDGSPDAGCGRSGAGLPPVRIQHRCHQRPAEGERSQNPPEGNSSPSVTKFHPPHPVSENKPASAASLAKIVHPARQLRAVMGFERELFSSSLPRRICFLLAWRFCWEKSQQCLQDALWVWPVELFTSALSEGLGIN